jgi:hypothetical protein
MQSRGVRLGIFCHQRENIDICDVISTLGYGTVRSTQQLRELIGTTSH